MKDLIQIQESEYDVILRQAVAEIDRTKTMVATTVCLAIGTAHWVKGKLIYGRKVEFKHEYAVKINYYLSLIDRLERREDENRSFGLILCGEKDRVEVELALEDMGKPIGIVDYQMIAPQ